MDIPLPFIVGCDLAGVVEKLGPSAKRFKVGDRVWGSNQGLLGRQGTFAEYAAVDEGWLYPTPDGVSDETAAACALVGITAHLGLVRDAKLKAGETLFVNGGTGGVGSMVVQMAKAIGARVITTAGSDEKVAAVPRARRRRGHQLQDRGRRGPREGARAGRRQRLVGNAPRAELRPDRAAARRARPDDPHGRPRRPPAVSRRPVLREGLPLYGFAMFNATPDEQRAAADDINRWLAEGKFKPRIDRVMPLDQAAAAHRLQEENTVGKAGTLAGKIVIKP